MGIDLYYSMNTFVFELADFRLFPGAGNDRSAEGSVSWLEESRLPIARQAVQHVILTNRSYGSWDRDHPTATRLPAVADDLLRLQVRLHVGHPGLGC